MPNSRYYTSQDVKSIFEYALTKINPSEKGLTRDTGCSNDINARDDEYVKTIIKKITGPDKDNFEEKMNSHDWVKMLKHVFQNGQIINFENIQVFKEWKKFSEYSRGAFAEKENPERIIEYVFEFKKFMAKLIYHGALEEANCIHHFLYLGNKVFSQDSTPNKENNSEKVASMLADTFYDGLQLEGMVKNFKLTELDTIQANEYIQRVQQSSRFLKNVIEDPLFAKEFNAESYVEFLIGPNKERDFEIAKGYPRKFKASHSLDSPQTLDPELIKSFKQIAIKTSKSTPEIYSFDLFEGIPPVKTFSYARGEKIKLQFDNITTDETFELEDQNKIKDEQKTKPKKKIYFSKALK